jgi:predicted exporter
MGYKLRQALGIGILIISRLAYPEGWYRIKMYMVLAIIAMTYVGTIYILIKEWRKLIKVLPLVIKLQSVKTIVDIFMMFYG